RAKQRGLFENRRGLAHFLRGAICFKSPRPTENPQNTTASHVVSRKICLSSRFLADESPVYTWLWMPVTRIVVSSVEVNSMQANGVIDQAVLESVQQWLALIDAGDWRESLNQASPLFKSGFQTATYFRRGVSEQEWESSLAYMQTHLGAAV